MPVKSGASFVGALSTRSSDNPADGHFFWLYKALHEYQARRGLRVPTVIGPDKTNSSFIVPFFKGDLRRLEFKVNPIIALIYGMNRLSQALDERAKHSVHQYFSYDGGLSDYWVVYSLALRKADTDFVFNFHWADQWLALTESKKISGVILTKLLQTTIQNAPRNLRFSAETKVFAKKLESSLFKELEIFPIFSAVSQRQLRAWEDREIHVLFLPQRASELDFVARASRSFESENIRVTVAVKRETWDRWGDESSKSSIKSPVILPIDGSDYEELLASTRVVVLPYNKPYFHWGSSGKFNEAIAYGCFPLVPRETAISSQSSGDPEDHEFSYPDQRSLLKVAKQILRRTQPIQLKPVTLEDFVEWMNRNPTPRYASSRVKAWAAHSALLFAASLYREGGLSTALRKLKKSAFARLEGYSRKSTARKS